MEPTTHLYLIRHGEAWTVKTRVVAGMRGDGGLTPLGQEQARRLRDRLRATGEIRADVLLASTLPRARQTAEIIAPAFGLPIIWDDDLHEIRPGDEVDGLPEEEFFARYGRPDFEQDPFRPLAPGGENWAQFILRICTTLDRIVREYAGKTIVLVCHGGVIDTTFISSACIFWLCRRSGFLRITRRLPSGNWASDGAVRAGGWCATTTTCTCAT
jgi:probable phosphoglycerate mutase